jgi:hypothetical protein
VSSANSRLSGGMSRRAYISTAAWPEYRGQGAQRRCDNCHVMRSDSPAHNYSSLPRKAVSFFEDKRGRKSRRTLLVDGVFDEFVQSNGRGAHSVHVVHELSK